MMPRIVSDGIRLLRRLLWWLPASACWFWDGKRFWLLALPLVFVCVLMVVMPSEPLIRLTGMCLQLGGIATIVLRLRGAQRQFPGQTLARWLQRRPRFWVQNTIMEAAWTSAATATAIARARVSPGPQATLEHRIAILEDSYASLFDEVGNLGSEVRRRTDELSSNLDAETMARKAGDKRVEEQLAETAVGGLHFDSWGVVYFILGSIAGTASPEIAAYLK